MISLKIFLIVNCLYAIVALVYRLYTNYAYKILQAQNSALGDKNEKIKKDKRKLSRDIKYFMSIIDDSDIILRTRRHLQESLQEASDLKKKYNQLKTTSILELKIVSDRMLEKCEKLKQKLVDFDADMFEKDQEIKKHKTRLEYLEKETVEQKVELRKLKKR